MPLEPAVRERLDSIVNEHPVVLFMKGNREQPMCGFSAAASRALNDLLPEYYTVDVLADPDIRQGVKEYGNWPTIPQLYVKGELVGGADIVRQMYASGELHTLFGLPQPDRTPPPITITDKAAEAIRANLDDSGEAVLHLDVGADHNAAFRLDAAGENDIVTDANGLEIHLDPGSAQHARGITIDWVETMQGAGLSLSFPGSGKVKPMTVAELKKHLESDDITLIDVRPARSRAELAPLPQAHVLDEQGHVALDTLPHDQAVAFICLKGASSKEVAGQFAAHGFEDVYSVEGGMNAWNEAYGG